jgi:hypothetical protein
MYLANNIRWMDQLSYVAGVREVDNDIFIPSEALFVYKKKKQ